MELEIEIDKEGVGIFAGIDRMEPFLDGKGMDAAGVGGDFEAIALSDDTDDIIA